MPNGYFSSPAVFLIEVIFGLYTGIVALRIIMQWAHWEYHNPLVQLIIRATQVPVKFLRRFIPPHGRWDSATIVLLISLSLVKILLITALQPITVSFILLIRLVAADIFTLFVTLFSASIIIQAIISWIAPANSYNPVVPLIARMNAPLLRPVRKLLPEMSGIDLSPLVVLIGLQVISMLVLPLLVGHY
jgi:YggT family protein